MTVVADDTRQPEVGVPLVHPGPAPRERIVSVPTGVDVVRASLEPGAVLTEAIWEVLERSGGEAASAEISGGTLGTIPFVFPALAGECEDRAVSFTDVHTSVGPSLLLGGSVSVGYRFGERFTHTHATWIEAGGTTRGGHLLPEATVGDVPVDLVLRVLHAARFTSTDDPETLMPAFAPAPRTGPTASGTGRAVISRVLPGVEIHDAVREVCARAGFGRARVHSSLGSTVGAAMVVGTAGDGTRPHDVDPPAVEFTRLVGSVAPGDELGEARVRLVGTCVDIHGEVHNGALVDGSNVVAVTFELFVEEVA